MTVYPGTGKPEFQSTASIRENGYNELRFTLTTHTGTHIDVPYHMIETGKTLDTYDIKKFIGRALIINCKLKILIDSDTIKNALNNRQNIDFLLFKTGWDQYWASKKYFEAYPILSKDATKLISKLSLQGIGIDAPSFDPLDSSDLPNHNLLLKSGFILVENLCNMYQIPTDEILFCCFPLKINKADGSPVRAVAIIT